MSRPRLGSVRVGDVGSPPREGEPLGEARGVREGATPQPPEAGPAEGVRRSGMASEGRVARAARRAEGRHGGAGRRPLSRSATPPQAGAGEGGRGAGASVPTATSRRCCLRDAPTSFRDFHDCICTFHACSGRSLRDQADFTSRDSREVTVSLHLASRAPPTPGRDARLGVAIRGSG